MTSNAYKEVNFFGSIVNFCEAFIMALREQQVNGIQYKFFENVKYVSFIRFIDYN